MAGVAGHGADGHALREQGFDEGTADEAGSASNEVHDAAILSSQAVNDAGPKRPQARKTARAR